MRLITFVLFSFTSGVASAQSTFNIVNHHQNLIATGGGRAVFEQADGYLMFSVQWAYDSTTSAFFVSKFDTNGALLYETQYQTANKNVDPGHVGAVTPLIQGGYAASLTLFSNDALTESHLYRFDNQGDTIWSRLFKVDTSEEWNHGTRGIMQLSDSSFMHWGWCEGNVGCITRLDSVGNVISTEEYTDTNYIFSACETPGGEFILGSSTGTYPNRGLVIKTNATDQEQWRRSFGGHAEISGSGVFATQDGGFLIPGAYEPTSSLTVDEYQTACLYKYDANGTFLWRKDYDYGFGSVRSRIAPAMDGNYWIIGGMRVWPSTPTFVMKVTAEGDSLWQRRYRYYYTDNAENIGYSITPTSDGGLVMTGLLRQGYQDPQPQLYSNWLIKLDADGCLIPGCGTVGVNEYAADLNQYFTVWPNPVQAGTPINFSFDPPDGFNSKGDLRAVLLDAMGREVYSQVYTGSTTQFSMPSAGLASGNYHLHLTDQRSWLAGAKVIVQ